MSKQRYRIRNWSDYNKALVTRGSVDIWLDQESISLWYEQSSSEDKQGRPQYYSDPTIQCALTLKAVFHLP